MKANDGTYHPGVIDLNHDRNIVLNQDGYGIAWYTFEKKGTVSPSKKSDILALGGGMGEKDVPMDPQSRIQYSRIRMDRHRSHILRDPSPINNCNYLKYISEKIISPLYVAHIRAATLPVSAEGKNEVVGENCHPFSYGKWTFVHNGCIPFFNRVKQHMIALTKPEFVKNISGTTDSEHIFAMFLSFLYDPNAEVP